MDIYYMHCNQMEAAHPSSRAVTLVTNVSHKDTPLLHPPPPPPPRYCSAEAGGPSAWEERERRECGGAGRVVLRSYEL